MNTNHRFYNAIILQGPCSYELWSAGAHAYDKEFSDKHAHFVIKSPVEHGGKGLDFNLWVRITAVEHEDGSGKSFNVSGFVSDECPIRAFRGRPFSGYYNAGSPRQGSVSIRLD